MLWLLLPVSSQMLADLHFSPADSAVNLINVFCIQYNTHQDVFLLVSHYDDYSLSELIIILGIFNVENTLCLL